MSDGIHGMVPREKMSKGARKIRDIYDRKPNAPFYMCEFGYYSMERWRKEGKLSKDNPGGDWWKDYCYIAELCGFDEPGIHCLGRLGWTEAAFYPAFEEKVIEDRGDYELVQDYAGRKVLFFKGRRNGFMPEYDDHPVKDMKTWEENCRWRLDPKTPGRFTGLEKSMEEAREAAGKGMIISQQVIGGYMYLRSLIGPLELLYKFHDDPGLIHACMETWLELADAVIEKHQQYVTIDELFIAEDICYNHGPLISPDMIREFLFPYYQQLISNIKRRQPDKGRHLYFHVDTDGYCVPIIPLYMELGMDAMSPFEAAAGCDVVKIGRQYPHIIMKGGIDKRVLAQGKEAIDRHLDYILPAMRRRGGYYPTCDHGVPEEVSFEDYLYFRKRCLEYAD